MASHLTAPLAPPAWRRPGLVLGLVAFLAFPGPGAGQSTGQTSGESAVTLPPAPGLAPLFHDREPLELRVEGDLHALLRDREEENPEREGRVILVHPDGTEEAFYVQLRTRGNFRLQSRTCAFPPIRFNFRKSEVEGTLLDGQDKVKVVTHCRDRYEANVVREYLAYRLYNVLTPKSFHARMARITWVDTAGEEEPVTRLGFLLEMEEAVAERLGGEVIPDEEQAGGIHPARIMAEEAIRVDLFNYLIGNTDFSMYGERSPPHNSVPIRDSMGLVIPVPYDFDFSGLVNAPYAEPAPGLDIRRVRDRLFRGVCRPGLDYGAAYALFRNHRDALTEVVRSEPLLSEDDREDVLDFLEGFWEVLEDEGRRNRRIERECRRV